VHESSFHSQLTLKLILDSELKLPITTKNSIEQLIYKQIKEAKRFKRRSFLKTTMYRSACFHDCLYLQQRKKNSEEINSSFQAKGNTNTNLKAFIV